MLPLMDNGIFIDEQYWPKIELLPFRLCLITTHTQFWANRALQIQYFQRILEREIDKSIQFTRIM
jgi:hypothetical protein